MPPALILRSTETSLWSVWKTFNKPKKKSPSACARVGLVSWSGNLSSKDRNCPIKWTQLSLFFWTVPSLYMAESSSVTLTDTVAPKGRGCNSCCWLSYCLFHALFLCFYESLRVLCSPFNECCIVFVSSIAISCLHNKFTLSYHQGNLETC